MSINDLRATGQAIWLDNITRDLLDEGVLENYIHDYGISGLTSNPAIFDAAIGRSHAYDKDIHALASAGLSGEDTLTEIALADLRRAADLFRPLFDRSGGVDGWVSMELSPMLAHDTRGSVLAATRLHALAKRPNLLVKIPGTRAGLAAVEAVIFAGIPVNITLLFSRDQYLAAAEAWLHGLEQRRKAGKDLDVTSVASVFISRWDVAVASAAPADLQGAFGINMGACVYAAYRELTASSRWRRLLSDGARPQRVLWASTGNRDPATSATRYVDALAAPGTIDTLPEKTLLALAGRGSCQTDCKPLDGDDAAARAVLLRFEKAGVNIAAVAEQLQRDGVQAFVTAWRSAVTRIAEKAKVRYPVAESRSPRP